MASLQNTMEIELHAEPSCKMCAKLIQEVGVPLRIRKSVYRSGLSIQGDECSGSARCKVASLGGMIVTMVTEHW